MTNRLCGTCRFFEASTLQTHGWCRNPAYPRRDELALLRKTELGCREGWGKDYWAAGGDPEGAALPSPEVAGGEVTAMPVGAGIAPLVPAEAASETPLLDAAPVAAPARVGYQGGGQDVVVTYDPLVTGHPELGDNGVPLPRVRRSTVAEAHRRALERREAERKALVQRRAGVDEAPLDPAPVAQSPAPGDQRTTPPAAEPEVRRFGVQPAPAADHTNGVQRDAPAPIAPAAPAAPPAAQPPAPLPPQGRGEPIPANPAPTTGPSEPRYWDQPPPTGRFIRMRPPAEDAPPAGERAEPGREVRQVGRLRPEPPPPPSPERPARMIRPLGEAQQAGNLPGAAPPGAPVRQARPQPAGVAVPELPPRQADQTLVRELEREWREQKLAAQAGKRCGTCRYYQATDGGRGACGCQFAPVYRQPLPPQELGCLNPLGSWWAAGDEGWLEKTEPRRPRRATPLLDALERELGEIAALAAAGALERRRQAR